VNQKGNNTKVYQVHASATSFEEIKLILHPDDSEVPSYENAYGVRWSVIEYSHMVTSSASWSGVRGTIGKIWGC